MWKAGTALLVENFVPPKVLDWAKTENANVLFYVPTVLGVLLETASRRGRGRTEVHRMPRRRSERSARDDRRRGRVFGASVHNLFGQTELAPTLTLTRRSDSIDDQLTTVGRPMPQVEVKIAGPDGTAIAPLGQQGEICARGYQQLIEYYKDPAATAKAVDSEGWLHTGDLGSMDDRGFITLTGRLKDLIISGGENIAPAEVESRLVEHESVLQAAVVGVPNAKWGEAVAAVLVVRGEQTVGLKDSVHAHLRDRPGTLQDPPALVRRDGASGDRVGQSSEIQAPRGDPRGRPRRVVMTTATARVDYSSLIQPERVHGSLYTDPAIFADELERIWYGGWVFVGHASEVRQPRTTTYARTSGRKTSS